VATSCSTVLFASMPASSAASTMTSPPAVTVPRAGPVNSMTASARLEPLLDARIPPPARPLAPYPSTLVFCLPVLASVDFVVVWAPVKSRSIAASTTFSLPAVALSVRAEIASTITSPPASTVVLRRMAVAPAGCSPSNASSASSGSPRIASRALNSRFCGFHPMELKAATALSASHASIVEVAVASSAASLTARTTTSPEAEVVASASVTGRAPVVVTVESVTDAVASARSVLVTMTAPAPSHGVTAEESEAMIPPDPHASTVSESAVTTASRTNASTADRTSLCAMRPK